MALGSHGDGVIVFEVLYRICLAAVAALWWLCLSGIILPLWVLALLTHYVYAAACDSN